MTEILRPAETIEGKQIAFEAEFDKLIDKIATYSFSGGKTGSPFIRSLLAFAKGDPVGDIKIIKSNIGLLDRGLNDPDLLPNAINAMSVLGHGPSFEGFLLMTETASKNKDSLRKGLELDDIDTRQAVIEIAASAHKFKPDAGLWEIVEEGEHLIIEDIDSDNPGPAISTLHALLNHEPRPGEISISDRIFSSLIEKVSTGEMSEDRLIEILSDLAGRYYLGGSHPAVETQVNSFLESRGVDPITKFLDYWLREGGVGDEVEINLKIISQIEKERPGIVRILHDRFGIRHFSRYPVNLLIDLYDSLDDNNTPYGLVINAQNDWNGAFRANNLSEQWSRLGNQIKGRYLMRFVEAENGLDLLKKVRRLSKSYGRFSFVFVNTHSNGDLIQLDEYQAVRTEDLYRLQRNPRDRFLVPDAPIILLGCSSGKKGDIAHQLAQRYGVRVIASKGLTTKTTIQITNFDPIDFKVVFHRGSKKNGTMGGAVEYDYRPR